MGAESQRVFWVASFFALKSSASQCRASSNLSLLSLPASSSPALEVCFVPLHGSVNHGHCPPCSLVDASGPRELAGEGAEFPLSRQSFSGPRGRPLSPLEVDLNPIHDSKAARVKTLSGNPASRAPVQLLGALCLHISRGAHLCPKKSAWRHFNSAYPVGEMHWPSSFSE